MHDSNADRRRPAIYTDANGITRLLYWSREEYCHCGRVIEEQARMSAASIDNDRGSVCILLSCWWNETAPLFADQFAVRNVYEPFNRAPIGGSCFFFGMLRATASENCGQSWTLWRQSYVKNVRHVLVNVWILTDYGNPLLVLQGFQSACVTK